MTEQRDVQREIRERVFKFRREHYPFVPDALYLGHVDYYELRLQSKTYEWRLPDQHAVEVETYMGLPVFTVNRDRHIGLGSPTKDAP